MTMLGAIAAGCCCCLCDQPTATAISPDGKNEIRLWTSPLAYEVVREGTVMVAKTEIGMKVDGQCLNGLGAKPVVTSEKKCGTIDTPVYKKAKVDLAGNETVVDFGSWSVRLAARNDGVAYRFETKKGGQITVNCEKAALTIPDEDATCTVYRTAAYACEESVPETMKAREIVTPGEAGKRNKMVYLPLVYEIDGKIIAVTESDVCDYPIWNMRRTAAEGVAFAPDFAHWPEKTYRVNWNTSARLAEGGRKINIEKMTDYLVKTDGTRTFPWRTFILTDRYAGLCEADIVYALARGKANCDFSWVKPGKVAWDWWNAWDNQGEEKGCNTKTYKRFIDFAAKTGVEYIIMDEGWSETLNIWKFHPNVDVAEVIRYGNEKGVGVILWMAWAQVYGDEERVASHFAKLGAKGFKVDFMDRGDADVECFLWKFADACARHKMVVDYHGMHRPTGMSRAYPNVLNYEGIHGLEQMKFYKGQDMVGNDVMAFFMRLTAGPMDYTPGAMDNYPVGTYVPMKQDPERKFRDNPGSEGTRCHQMAMMAAYEAPLQMLSDSPTKYEKNLECFSFMAATPVVWADTVGLGGCPESCAAVARKAKDGSWYAAALANRKGGDFVLDTSFLGSGDWKAEIFRDAADSDKVPTNYVRERGTAVKAGAKLFFRMAPGGGFIVRFTK